MREADGGEGEDDDVQDLLLPKGRALSSSYVPEVGEPCHEEMIEELERIVREHQTGGNVVLRYDTRVYFGRPNF